MDTIQEPGLWRWLQYLMKKNLGLILLIFIAIHLFISMYHEYGMLCIVSIESSINMFLLNYPGLLWNRRNDALIKDLSTPTLDAQDLHFDSMYAQSFLVQCAACLLKQHWSHWKKSTLYSGEAFLYHHLCCLVLSSGILGSGIRLLKFTNLSFIFCIGYVSFRLSKCMSGCQIGKMKILILERRGTNNWSNILQIYFFYPLEH